MFFFWWVGLGEVGRDMMFELLVVGQFKFVGKENLEWLMLAHSVSGRRLLDQAVSRGTRF